MARLPTDLSGRDVRRALEQAGFVFRRQRGSHMVLRRDNPFGRAVIPDHKQIRLGTLHRILTARPSRNQKDLTTDSTARRSRNQKMSS